MTTTAQMLERELPKPALPEGTSIGIFSAENTVQQILIAAKTVEKLGYVPELRLSTYCDKLDGVELFVRDIPSLIGKLRASLEATNGRRA